MLDHNSCRTFFEREPLEGSWHGLLVAELCVDETTGEIYFRELGTFLDAVGDLESTVIAVVVKSGTLLRRRHPDMKYTNPKSKIFFLFSPQKRRHDFITSYHAWPHPWPIRIFTVSNSCSFAGGIGEPKVATFRWYRIGGPESMTKGLSA